MKNRLNYLEIKKDKKTKKKYFCSLRYPEIPPSVHDLWVVTTAGDRLDLLANRFYKDVRLWWVIANANRDIIQRDSFMLKSGLQIRIPSNISSILKAFEIANKKAY